MYFTSSQETALHMALYLSLLYRHMQLCMYLKGSKQGKTETNEKAVYNKQYQVNRTVIASLTMKFAVTGREMSTQ